MTTCGCVRVIRFIALLDTGAEGRKHVCEQERDQLLSLRRRPVLRNFRHQRICRGEDASGVVHALTQNSSEGALGESDASITAFTAKPSRAASIEGKMRHAPMVTPAMIGFLRPVASIASRNA